MSSRDIALRDLDQAGFRIANLGTPDAGDATKTDNSSVPKPSAGTGSPGISYLAAPADHVHPASSGEDGTKIIHMEDSSEQAITGSGEELVAEFLVNTVQIESPFASVSHGAIVKVSEGTARLRVRIGGTPGFPDGEERAVATAFVSVFDLVSEAGGRIPINVDELLVKLTIQNDTATATVNVRSKFVTLIARANVASQP